jgi:hypothetical protein
MKNFTNQEARPLHSASCKFCNSTLYGQTQIQVIDKLKQHLTNCTAYNAVTVRKEDDAETE